MSPHSSTRADNQLLTTLYAISKTFDVYHLLKKSTPLNIEPTSHVPRPSHGSHPSFQWPGDEAIYNYNNIV